MEYILPWCSIVSSFVAIISLFYAVSAKKDAAQSKDVDDRVKIALDEFKSDFEDRLRNIFNAQFDDKVKFALSEFKNTIHERLGESYISNEKLELKFQLTHELIKQLDHRLTRTQQQLTMCLKFIIEHRGNTRFKFEDELFSEIEAKTT